MTREEAITVLKALSDNPLFSYQHRAAFSIAIHDIKQRHDWDINKLILINKDNYESLEQEPVIDKIRADITKFADTIPFNIGEDKAKYRNFGQYDGLEQALEIIEGNIEGDFDIDKWIAESEK